MTGFLLRLRSVGAAEWEGDGNFEVFRGQAIQVSSPSFLFILGAL